MQGHDRKHRDIGKLPLWWYLFLAVPLFLYFKGLAPTVVHGDTGDYLTAGWIHGISHPPGYPLYIIMVGIMERIPLQPFTLDTTSYSVIAWRANLLSALISTITLACMYALLVRITRFPLAAVIGSLSLAFASTFWWHSEIAENDALSCLLIVLILLFTVKWLQDRKIRDFYLIAFIYGLAICHHQALLLLAPALIFALASQSALPKVIKPWIPATLLFIVGFLPFLYLPLTQYKTPDGTVVFTSPESPSETVNIQPDMAVTPKSKIGYFMDYIGRGIYSRQREYTHTPESLDEDVTSSADVFRFYLTLSRNDFSLFFFLPGLVILLLPWVLHKSEYIRNSCPDLVAFTPVLSVAWLVYFLVILLVPTGDILRAPFYNLETAGPGLMLPLHVLLALAVGSAFGLILSCSRTMIRNNVKPIRFLTLIITVIAILALAVNVLDNSSTGDKSSNTLMHEYCVNALDSCVENSVLVVAGDELYSYWYMNHVHVGTGYRPDVTLHAWSSELASLGDLENVPQAMADSVAGIISENPGRTILTTFFNSSFLEHPVLGNYTIARRGIVFEFIPPGNRIPLEYQEVHPDIAEWTGIDYIVPGFPDNYLWEYWGGNVMGSQDPVESGVYITWPPEIDIQWRNGEMLNFYGLDAFYKNDLEVARGYFRQMLLVEPSSSEAHDHLEIINYEIEFGSRY